MYNQLPTQEYINNTYYLNNHNELARKDGGKAKRYERRGYIIINTDVGELAEHRLVYVLTYGDCLTGDYAVDHMDGNKSNNNPDNLMRMANSQNLTKYNRENI